MEIKLVIPGRPVPKKRPRVGMRGRRVYVYTPPETQEYEEFVKEVGMEQIKEPLSGPVEIRLKLYFCGERTPDLSNCLKSIEDGLNGVAYGDDSQIKRVVAEMYRVARRDEERAEVEVRRYDQARVS